MTTTTTSVPSTDLAPAGRLDDVLRRLALVAGPAAVVAVLLFVASLVRWGDDGVALAKDPLAIASSGLGLLSLVGIGAGLLLLCQRVPRLPGWGAAIAAAAVVLAIGAQWSQLVVLPALAYEEPRLATTGLGPVTAGFIAAFILLAVGWFAVAMRLRDAVPVRLMVAGAVICIPPLPVRWAVLAVAISLIARRIRT
jgi:hypothetical protein